LAALSLALALEARKGEIALLRALGWSRGHVMRVLMAEWCVPLGVGALAGSCGGAVLARALVWSLGRFWRDAFAGAEPHLFFRFRQRCWQQRQRGGIAADGAAQCRALCRVSAD
jgi:hypothetical protein